MTPNGKLQKAVMQSRQAFAEFMELAGGDQLTIVISWSAECQPS